MATIRRFIAVVVVAVIPVVIAAAIAMSAATPALAHNAEVSTYAVRRRGGLWTLQVSLATAGLDHALAQRLGQAPRTQLRYKTETVRLVREGMHLVLNDQPTALGIGGIKLGGHQTDLVFSLPTAPQQITSLLGTRITAGQEVPNQHNVLRIVRAEGLEQWVLAARNRFTLTGDVPRSGAEVHAPAHRHTAKKPDNQGFGAVGIVVVGLLMAALAWRMG